MAATEFRTRAFLAATITLCASLALAGCASGATSGVTPRATATATSGPGPQLTPTTVTAMLTASARGAVGSAASAVAVTYDTTTEHLAVTLTITGDVPTTDVAVVAAVTRAQTLTFQEQNGLWASGQPLRQVMVTVMGPAQDPYDGIINQVYSVAIVSEATARRIPWASATPRSAWSLYDQTFLRPGFVVQDHTLPDTTATPGG